MLKTEKITNILIVKFNGVDRFNAMLVDPVKHEINAYFDKPNTRLILDLDGIRFVDSSGFGVFLSILKTAHQNQGQFKICNVRPEVYDLFKLLQLDTVFAIYDSREACVESFN